MRTIPTTVLPGQSRPELQSPLPWEGHQREPIQIHDSSSPPAAVQVNPGRSLQRSLSSSEQSLDEARERLGNTRNTQSLITALGAVQKAALENPSLKVATLLDRQMMPADALSTFGRENRLEPASQVPVAWFLRESGLNVPHTPEQLADLLYASSNPLPEPLERGNYWGLLSMPLALDAEQRRRLQAMVSQTLAEVSPGKGLFALFQEKHVDSSRPAGVVQRIEQMIESPEVQALGKKLEAAFDGVSTPSSAAQWAMAAMVLELDPHAGSQRGQVAGYDLLAPANWGVSPAVVVERLSQHLVAQGKVTSALAPAAAWLLLVGAAPTFLVPDMPANLVVGSPAWMRLTAVVEASEHAIPGVAACIPFGEWMTRESHGPVSLTQAIVERHAQEQALVDWGIAQGRVPANPRVYTPEQLDGLRTTFNETMTRLQKAQSQLAATMPTRRDIALAELKKAYGDDVSFEVPNISITHIDASESELHSLLDIYMAGKMDRIPRGVRHDFSLGNRHYRVTPLPDVGKIFDEQFDAYVSGLKASLTTLVAHQLSQLPLSDRQTIASGQVEFFSLRKASEAQAEGLESDAEAQAAVARYGLWMRVLTPRDKRDTGRAYADFKHASYELFPLQGLIRKREDLPRNPPNPAPRVADPEGYAARQAKGIGEWLDYEAYRSGTAPRPGTYSHDLLTEKLNAPLLPEDRKAMDDAVPTIDHPRFGQIAEVMANHLLYDPAAMKAAARGSTAVEDEEAQIKAGHDFVTGLIPLKNAIENAANGNVGAAVRDFALDIFGFVVPVGKGLGSAAKVAGKVTERLGTRAFKASDILFRAALSGLNPAEGLGGLGLRATQGIKTLWQAGHRELKWLQGQGFNLNAYAKMSGAVEGEMGLASASTQGLKVIAKRHRGKWHAYDVTTRTAYGPALKDFRPVSPPAVAPGAVDNVHFDKYAVSKAKLAGLTPDSQGIYRGEDGAQYIRHADGSGKTSVYKVREVSQAGSPGSVQARLINPKTNRQTEFLFSNRGNEQWRRLGLQGGDGIASQDYKLVELPMDEVEQVVRRDGQITFLANFTTEVRFDAELGAWRKIGRGDALGDVFWRAGPYDWRAGPLQEYLKVKDTLPSPSSIRTVRVAALPIPQAATAIPKEINYIWAGGSMPDDRLATVLSNAEKTSAYKTIVHIDADTPQVFEQIKAQLQGKGRNLDVRNLNDDAFFKAFKASDSGEVYQFFRQGAGQNYAAASDALRYPLINHRGGIYLDSDDVVTANIGEVELKATGNQVLLNSHVSYADTDFIGYNTSVFASHPNNPVLRDISDELYRRFKGNQQWLEGNRPYLKGTPTAEQIKTFNEYQTRIFEVTGPTLFNDVLRKTMGSAYDLSWAATDPSLAGIKLSSSDATAFAEAYNHYLPFNSKFAVEIGSQTSMARAVD